MKVDFDISGWREDYSYEKHDVVFFTGEYKNSTTGCLQQQSGYYYASAAQDGAAGSYNATVASQSPSGAATKWTRSFPSSPSYGSKVSFFSENDRINLGDGYFKLTPKSHNNIDVTYNLNFSSRSDKESKAIMHFLGHRFETPYSGATRTDDGIQTLTGFNFTPFAPYNQTGLFTCENFNYSNRFPDVNDIEAIFIDDTNTPTNWKNRIINLDSTSGFWAESISYSKFDIVYYSGHGITNHSGYYYYSGDAPSTSSSSNQPEAAATVWTKNNFFFKPTTASNNQSIRNLKPTLSNEYIERYSDGLNSSLLNLTLSFDGRDNKEAKALSHFLINKQGYESFKFTPPKPYKQATKHFVCPKWSENVIFDENRSFSTVFEEYPLEVFQQGSLFKTYVFDTGSSTVLGSGLSSDGAPDEITNINFGRFMTGFSSGTGFYLVNSGNRAIVSDLHLSGTDNTTGLYKFKTNDNPDFEIIDGCATHARYRLGTFQSGLFEVEFATTGKSSLTGHNANLGLDGGITFYDQGHGGAGYPGLFDRNSQLYINTTDEFGTTDPSGSIKIDLTGNAEAIGPGPITNFSVAAPEGSNYLITGGFSFSEPFTATGITLEVSGIDDKADVVNLDDGSAADPATGLYENFNPIGSDHRGYYLQPLKNYGVKIDYVNTAGFKAGDDELLTGLGGAFYFYGKPGKNYYFRIKSENIDIIGGNINGGTSRTVLSSDYAQASGSLTNQNLSVFVDEEHARRAITHGRSPCELVHEAQEGGLGGMLANVNLNEFASGQLIELKNSINNDNKAIGDVSDIAVTDFEKVIFHFGPNLTVFSDETRKPAVDTGPGMEKSDTIMPIDIRIPATTCILGAGGSGANAADANNVPAASFHIQTSQIDSLGAGADGRSRSRVGSVIELGGIGPISAYATSGKMDGKYFLPYGTEVVGVGSTSVNGDNVAPANGEHGGTALHIDSSYSSIKVGIHNLGFIGGGGGGGGVGGARLSNQSMMWRRNYRGLFWVGGDYHPRTDTYYQDPPKVPSAQFRLPESKTKAGEIVPEDVRLLAHKGSTQAQLEDVGFAPVRAVRPGGGGGAGLGFRLQKNGRFVESYALNKNPVPRAFNVALPEHGSNTINIEVAPVIAPALGGRGAKPNAFYKANRGGGIEGKWAIANSRFYVKEPSLPGSPCQISMGATNIWQHSKPGLGGLGANGYPIDQRPVRGYLAVDSPSGLRVMLPDHRESEYNGGGQGGMGGYWGFDGMNGEHPYQNYMDRYISADKGPEPRNFGYGGTGGLCIETNGAKLTLTPTGYYLNESEDAMPILPCSGTDDRSEEDAKSSDLYRNYPGLGGYLTPKIASFTVPGGADSNTMVAAANELLPVPLVSGLHARKWKATDSYRLSIENGFEDEVANHRHYTGPSFEGCDRKKNNSSNAISDTASGAAKLPWKTLNRTINGSFDDYVLLDNGGFPYYLIYDFGESGVAVSSLSLTSAGASFDHFTSDNQESIFGEVWSPTDFELRATNAAPDAAPTTYPNADGTSRMNYRLDGTADETIAPHMLDSNTDLLLSVTSKRWSPSKSTEREGEIPPGDASMLIKMRTPYITPVEKGSKDMYSEIRLIKDGANPTSSTGSITNKYLTEFGIPRGNQDGNYICVPGATRNWNVIQQGWTATITIGGGARIKAKHVKKYRYYILKILAADNFPGVWRAAKNARGNNKKLRFPFGAIDGKCKIADVGFRAFNKNYAGFISIRS